MSSNGDFSSPMKKRFSIEDRPYHGVATYDYDDSRDEKPWQRALYQINKKGKHLYEPVRSVPSAAILVVLGIYLLLAYLTIVIEHDMPRVVTVSEASRDNTFIFSEERAWNYLKLIVGDGPRVAGTAYHLEKTLHMKEMVDNISRNAFLPVRTNLQVVSGDFWLHTSSPYHTSYENASNVIALLEGRDGYRANSTSILFNCHYDSVPFAHGASDNALFCAVLAETLSVLSKRRERFKHNIIFLFNGAEEMGLLAAHGFLKHEWARNIVSVVNLDSAGMNGKPNLFQVTDSRVLNAFRKRVRRPAAQSFGEFLFSSGVIPSDTDFRIWRDFGNMTGIDIAFAKMGHVYHTRYDHVDLLNPGVIQVSGDMVLDLATELANMNELEEKVEPGPAVYYDYLNLSVSTYSLNGAHAVDALIAILAVLSVLHYAWIVGLRKSTFFELLYAIGGRLAAVAAGSLVTIIFIYIMLAADMQLRYLTQAWIIFPLYWMPYLITAVAVSQYYDAWRCKKSGLNRCVRTEQSMAATRCLLTLALLIMLCIPSTVTIRYALSLQLLLISLASFVSLTLHRYLRMHAWQHLVVQVLLSLPTMLFFLSVTIRVNALLVPIMGRTPTTSPDLIIGVVNLILAILVAATFSGVELLFSRRLLWVILAVAGVTSFVLMFIPFSPYQDEGPSVQRHYWFHNEVVSYDLSGAVQSRRSGVLITRHDAYTTTSALKEISARHNLHTETDLSRDCEEYVYCNVPVYRTSFVASLRQAASVSMDPPKPFSPRPQIIGSKSCVGDSCTLTMNITTSPHNLLTIRPLANVSLEAWSFEAEVRTALQHRSRPVYVVLHNHLQYSNRPLRLLVTLQFTVPQSLQSGAIVEISHHAHHLYNPTEFTTEYRNLVESMPKYFNIASTISFRNNYVF